jgi:hypothetical protein
MHEENESPPFLGFQLFLGAEAPDGFGLGLTDRGKEGVCFSSGEIAHVYVVNSLGSALAEVADYEAELVAFLRRASALVESGTLHHAVTVPDDYDDQDAARIVFTVVQSDPRVLELLLQESRCNPQPSSHCVASSVQAAFALPVARFVPFLRFAADTIEASEIYEIGAREWNDRLAQRCADHRFYDAKGRDLGYGD